MITHTIAFATLLQLATIAGQVRDARTNSPIPAAMVELRTAQIPVGQQFTDGEGRFGFPQLMTGRYTIHVTSSGYESLRIEVDMLSGAFPLMIELVRMKSPRPVPAAVMSLRDYSVPERARKEFEQAREQIRRQNCSKAIDHFEKGLRRYDKDASVHNDLGNCHRKLGHFDRAEDSFKRARTLSDSVYAAINLAEVYWAQKRFEEAASVLDDAIRRNPETGDGHYGLALMYAAQGLLEDAANAAREAETRPHRIADVHLLLAEIYTRENRHSEAVRQLETYLKEQPNGPLSDRVRKDLQDRR